MLKEEKFLLPRIFWIVGLLFLINIANFVFYVKSSQATITGNAIKDDIFNFYYTMPKSSKIFLLIQWLLLISLLIYINIKDKIIIEKHNSPEPLVLNNDHLNSKTDIDALVILLKENKEIPISVISRTFNIDDKLAMDWAKMLETTNYAKIDFPRFGPPMLRLVEEKT
jgi:hypothetical protein